MKKHLLTALLATLALPPVFAADLAVKVDHDVTVLGADGVTRINRFSERLIRRDNQSWVARILPPHAHEDEDHKAGDKGHKHMDLAAAARWVQRGEDGKLRVRLVNEHERMVVEIAPVDYANIGFDGKWSSANQLLDPEQIKRMQTSKRSAPAGARWYEGGTRSTRVQVLWDEKEQYPRRIESNSVNGSSHSTMVVTRESMPATLPWTRLAGYIQKDYSDLLD